MSEIEIALRLAADVLRDAAECRRMPSGKPLLGEAVELHASAADRLERLLIELQRRGSSAS